MRKNNVLTGLIMAVMLMVSANLFATDYEVSGAGIADINGTYVENGTNCGKPKYEFTNGGTTYYLAFNNIDFGDYWIIGESAALVDMPGSEYYISSSSDTPPSDGWNVMGSGDPAPTVSLARPNLSRNADIFYESTDNDGSIANTITITYNLPEGDSFSGSNGTFSTDNYTTANVPAGLSVSITKNSDTELSVALTGNASSHAYTDDISNLEITFLDAAFTNGDASAVNNSTQSNIEVDYGLLITSLTDLQTLSNTSANWDEYIIQTIDIDASATSGWNSGAGFSPIGNSTTKFTGYYNGGDHSIDNLFINRPATDYIGLFGYVDGATIKNIGVTNVDISGEYYVGGLVGYNNNSSAVNNSYSSGSVTGNNRYVGGLVGQNYNSSTITNSYSSGSVTGSADYTGGLVGRNTTSTITNSYSSSSVFGPSYVGGLVGRNNNATISNSYSTGDVTRNAGSTSTYFGGFCGYSYNGSIESSYSVGSVFYAEATDPTDKGFVGGETGDNNTYTANFFDSDASNQSSDAVGAATALSTAQMQDYNTFTDVTGTTVGLTSAWDMIGTENDDAGTNDYWDMDQEGTVNNAYPILSWQDGADDILFELPYSGGSGTSGDPYQIATTDDLIELSNTSADWDKHFIQTADIAFDATEINVDWNGDGSTGPAEGFSPIGNNTTNFTGSYDGQNHTIDNLFINRLFEAYIGLFGNTMNAIIRNLGVTNIDITGDYYTGALIGSSESGSVSNCYSTGSVSGDYDIGGLIGSAFGGSVSDSYSSCTVTGSNYYIGGLIGSNSNSIDNCYSTGDVEGSDNVGGLLGFNSGAVSQSYSTGSVSADYSWKVGGLIGINMMASIENCYSTSDVTTGLDISEQTVGAFIGSNGDGTEGAAGGDVSYCYATGDVVYDGGTNPTDKGFVGVSVATGDQTPVYTANFFDSEASNQSSDAVEAATAKTTTEMQTQSTYTNAGWDFIVETTNGTDDIWKSTITYPHFACFIPPTQACEVGCSDAGSGSLELSWTRGNGDGNAVFIAQASNGTASPVDNEEYTANTEFGSGEQIGASGWYCVYVGTGTSVTVTGLSSETAYRVHVCEYNLGSIYYNDETSTNNPQNYEEPVVVELSAFKAQISNATVTLTWSTEGETGTAGFHIYRSADRNGSYGRVNAALIAATGAATRGADYDYIDDEPLSGDAFYKLQSVDVDGSTQFSRAVSTALTGVEEQNMPERFALHQNYPNPFNPTTTLRYDLPQDAHVTCVVYNVQGQKLATLIDSHKPAGEHAYTWNAAERFSSGLYIIVMRAGEQVFRQKVSLVK